MTSEKTSLTCGVSGGMVFPTVSLNGKRTPGMIDVEVVWCNCFPGLVNRLKQRTTLLFQREILAGNVSATSAIAVSLQSVTRLDPLIDLLGLRLGPACRPSFELLAPKVYNFLRLPTRRYLQAQ